MIVSKFGGTSVGSAQNIKQVVNIIKTKALHQAVVVSAVGGITNLLVKAADEAKLGNTQYQDTFNNIQSIHFEVIKHLNLEYSELTLNHITNELNALKELLHSVFTLQDLSHKTSANILSFGEKLSSKIIVDFMKSQDIDVVWQDASNLIKTDGDYIDAKVNLSQTYSNIKDAVENNKAQVHLFPGFIATNQLGEITTLGRGGSDFTAAILAHALEAKEFEIWTDVSGLYTANPKLVKQAQPINQISYQEAMELSYFGAKVIYPPTIQPALEQDIPIKIKNTFKPSEEGTTITKNPSTNGTVKGISHIENIAMVTLQGNGMIGIPGISKRFFEALYHKDVNVILITQASSEHSICIAVDKDDADKAKLAIDQQFALEIMQKQIEPVNLEYDLAIVALVGDQMKSHQGISGQMFSSLGHNNVNIRAIAQGSTEKNISAIIAKKDIKKALNSLHATFFEDHIKQINLFITGVGNVGGKLLEQISNQQQFLKNQLHIDIRVIGLSNSKNMVFDKEGIDLNNWKSKLNNSELEADFEGYFNEVKALNLRNSVFVDNTANDELPNWYSYYLKESIAVVACNKVACSSPFENYTELKRLAREYQAPFLFETNVGAGLPIIDTLKNLINSGDRIHKIQAVLSGSLNFIFNNYNASQSFKDIIIKAGEEGFTEPDPRIDLSGVDVARKILILIRESGISMELSDIKNNSFLPQSTLDQSSVDQFITEVGNQEEHFKQLFEKANSKGHRLKYVAEFNNGNAQVGLQEVSADHDFYNLDGKDNIVLFYTDRYAEQPLIVKGAGAGADVTASGIFGDIIRTINQ